MIDSDLSVQRYFEPHLSLGFPTRSDTNRAVQPQEMARGFKFWIKKVEGLYYTCRENKGTELRSYRPADLCVCFHFAKGRYSLL